MDNDFLDYLRKTMMSGMGIPSSMLNYADEIEFARTLSMQNGMFLRSVIMKQKKLTPPFSSMYQDLYLSEYGNGIISLNSLNKEINKNEKDEKDNKYHVDIENILVQFPSPSSLNSTNISEQINVGNGIVQAIGEAMFDANDQNIDNVHKFKFIQELNRLYIPNVDWNQIDELYEKSKLDSIETKINSKTKQSAENDSSEESGF